jgi:hypothetical protein
MERGVGISGTIRLLHREGCRGIECYKEKLKFDSCLLLRIQGGMAKMLLKLAAIIELWQSLRMSQSESTACGTSTSNESDTGTSNSTSRLWAPDYLDLALLTEMMLV